MSMGFVCAMGMGTVFIGLVCIVILCVIFSAIIGAGKNKKEEKAQTAVSAPVTNNTAEIPERQKVLAAVCAVLAEELGTDVSALKVHSFKKL